jgi:serine protease AprX
MLRPALVLLGVFVSIAAAAHGAGREAAKLDAPLRAALGGPDRTVRVIVRGGDAAAVEGAIAGVKGLQGRRLPGIGGVVAQVRTSALAALAASPHVARISLDRRIAGTLQQTSATIGSNWVVDGLGIAGAGIGVAIIDSGVAASHDDLGPGRVVHFVDFVDFRSKPHDGYGHGTHVAGIIAGSGQGSAGARQGIAPAAHLVVLKTLDAQGQGHISDAIAALDYAVEHRAAYNIRIVNLSVAAGVYESYRTDPLTLAAARAVDAGLVVVTAAGNLGRGAKGSPQYGGITAPGNAPWVLTVGASTHNGTVTRNDDAVAAFSSLGPSAIDLVAKPDLVAPGVGIESLAEPGSTLYTARPHARVWGRSGTTPAPYLRLSGTSMAAPVVAGTVALMLEANPVLTPRAVKAILRTTAEPRTGEDPMAQGAGFLDAKAAVELARTFDESRTDPELLDQLVEAYEPDEGTWPAPCEAFEADCRYLTDACTAFAGCFGELAGAVTGMTTPVEDPIAWTPRTRPARRQRRAAGWTTTKKKSIRNPGTSE